MSAQAAAPDARGGGPRTAARRLLAALGGLLRGIVAAFLALHPLGAILVLGWLMRLMRSEARQARERLIGDVRARRAPLPGWIMADETEAAGRLGRLAGGLWLNLREGAAALATLAAGTLPFTLLWLLSWWGGWENSFNKGYEQSWIGPSVGLAGVALSLPLLARLPMALAHQAVEGRMSAFFAGRPVARLIRAAGWRYVGLAFVSVLAALPLAGMQSLPVFIESWRPTFPELSPEEVERYARNYRLLATAYLVAVTIALRRVAARLHARASLTLEAGETSRPAASVVGASLRTLLLWACWFGVVAQVFVAQFLNHQWVVWLLPPLSSPPLFAPLAPVP